MKIDTDFDIGDKVYDNSSGCVVTIVGISITLGYTDNTGANYLEGSTRYHIEYDHSAINKKRYSWDITKLEVINKERN